MNIDTVQFTHILETSDLDNLHPFLSRTAFIISHKSESIETLLRVLWYLPVDSTIIIVTNSPQKELGDLTNELQTHLTRHKRIYLVHQKDERIAQLFNRYGVEQILGNDGKVVNGKGEGMYIGTICARMLNHIQWVIFYDADNFVPSALLEYTVAMSRLFLTPATSSDHTSQKSASSRYAPTPDLHNIRICWSSKPGLDQANWRPGIMGRTTQVVSPLFNILLATWFGIHNHTISSSNAGEQGMTIETALTLRFSSGFSVETFQLLDLLDNAMRRRETGKETVFRQYLSKSPHFHEKKEDDHIKRMIAESLGTFLHFETHLPDEVRYQLDRLYKDLELAEVKSTIYPAPGSLPLQKYHLPMEQFALFPNQPEVPASLEPVLVETLPIEALFDETRPLEALFDEALLLSEAMMGETMPIEAVLAEVVSLESLRADVDEQKQSFS